MKQNYLYFQMFISLFLCVCSAVAQDRVLSGKVTDQNKLPLAGVNVVIKGTVKGTQTDFEGNYSIRVSEGQTLLFSFIGQKEVSRVVGTAATMDVQMEEDAEALGEVIVVGYGTSTKGAFTGTATEVDAEKLVSKNTSNVSQALAGEVAGVTVINTSGQPGTTATVRIRGFGSVNGNRDPLYVLDGVPFGGNINSINPSDIESTTVLKDASATAIYGARGANGVILITTKKGKAGKSQIEVHFKQGLNIRQLPRYERITNQEEYVALGWESLKNLGSINAVANPEEYASQRLFSRWGIDPFYNMWDAEGEDLIDPATGKFRPEVSRTYTPERWEDVLFRDAERTEVNIRLSGGVDKTTYSTSFGFLEDQGYYLKSNYKRYTSRMDIGHQVKTWLKGSMNLGYTYSESNQGGQTSDSGSGFWFTDNIPTIYGVYLRDADGKLLEDPIFKENYQFDYGENGRGFGAFTNAAGDLTYNINRTKAHEVNGNTYLEASFLKHFKMFARLGMQYRQFELNSLGNPFYGASAPAGGSISKSLGRIFSLNFLQGLTYTNDFDLHSISASFFHETNDYAYNNLFTYKTGLVDPFGLENNNAVVQESSNSYLSESRMESFFGKVDYSYDTTYYASFTLRRDGSSRFKNTKWGTFYSIGLGWIASKESFLEDVAFLDYLKMKMSYGVIGDHVGASFYSGDDLFTASNLNNRPSLQFTTKGNPDLTWETAKIFQIGTEVDINGRFEAEIDYYVKNTENLFFDNRVGISTGYAFVRVNQGILRNAGLEFSFTGHLVKNNDFTLDLTWNGELLSNTLTEMPIDPITKQQKVLDQSSVYGRSRGHSLFDFYMRDFTGVDPETGVSTWALLYDDKNDDGELQDGEEIKSLTEYLSENPDAKVLETTTKTYANATQKYVGKSAIPDIRGAFRIETKYKGIEFSAQFLYQFGGYAVDWNYRNLMHNRKPGSNLWHVDIRDRWQQPGDITGVPRISAEGDLNANSTSTRFLTKSDYLSLNNIRLGYHFSERITKKIDIKKLSLFLSGDNLWLWSSRKGFNPSTSETGGSSMYRYAPLTTYTAGIRIEF